MSNYDHLPAVVKETYDHVVDYQGQKHVVGVTSVLRMEDGGMLTPTRLAKIFNEAAKDFHYNMATDFRIKDCSVEIDAKPSEGHYKRLPSVDVLKNLKK
jgi:hypothetical protein